MRAVLYHRKDERITASPSGLETNVTSTAVQEECLRSTLARVRRQDRPKPSQDINPVTRGCRKGGRLLNGEPQVRKLGRKTTAKGARGMGNRREVPLAALLGPSRARNPARCSRVVDPHLRY